MSEKLKYHYNEPFVRAVAEAMQSSYAAFDKERFVALVFDEEWDSRELKDRMRHVTISVCQMLPDDYDKAINILRVAAQTMDRGHEFERFLNMFFPDFVELYGQGDWEVSLAALCEFTRYSSSEFAVRSFIVQDSDRMMAQMEEWAKDSNHHVRRLASEGCRPRLPWAMALRAFKKDPTPILPILDILKDDAEEYVRRSVANNLNDISKDNPDIVLKIAKKWYGKSKNGDRLVKHACRTLLKAGNRDALAIFGFTSVDNVRVKALTLKQNRIQIGDTMTFAADLTVLKRGKLRFEYAIDFMKSNGKTTRKIFQIKEISCKTGDISFTKNHSLREMSTRKHYVGRHAFSLLINGIEMTTVPFFLDR